MITTLASEALVLAVALPMVSFVFLGLSMLLSHKPNEVRVHQILATTMLTSLTFSTGLLIFLLAGAVEPISVELGSLIAVRGYHFDLALRADILSAVYLWLDLLLCGLVGAFSARYLHQDEGYHRFYLLLMAFTAGVALIATGGGLDLLFAGWEMVGLSSALLIAFFVRRKAPVENGLRAYGVYRITDVGLLLAIVTLHHYAGSASFGALSTLTDQQALIVGGLLIFGSMGKGAIVPFTPWLPRAMEGPTPSSAIFYGALSIHASPFLLMKVSPVFEDSLVLNGVIIGLGVITAVHASMVGRAQTDIKTSLGYASVTQVGIMWVWIGLGLFPLAIIHMVGHAILRTRQLLRAPSLLHDRHQIVIGLGADLKPTGQHIARFTPDGFRRWTYRMAIERWYIDDLWDATAAGMLAVLNLVDSVDQRWAQVFREEYTKTSADLQIEPLEAYEK